MFFEFDKYKNILTLYQGLKQLHKEQMKNKKVTVSEYDSYQP